MSTLPTLQQACEEVAPKDLHLLPAIAVDDMRARLVTDLLATSREEALEYLRTVKARIDTLHQLENDSK
jgi:hypothetical protein